MSHNPPDPALLDILDALGVLVWDETRDFTLAQV
jgi:beta-galactosidase/beta-glucuronidase